MTFDAVTNTKYNQKNSPLKYKSNYLFGFFILYKNNFLFLLISFFIFLKLLVISALDENKFFISELEVIYFSFNLVNPKFTIFLIAMVATPLFQKSLSPII